MDFDNLHLVLDTDNGDEDFKDDASEEDIKFDLAPLEQCKEGGSYAMGAWE